jgi:hypothetical protein
MTIKCFIVQASGRKHKYKTWVEVSTTLAYYDAGTIATVKCFIVDDPFP